MTVQEKIRKDLKEAMIKRQTHARDILRVVIGEFNREGKTVSDERAIAIMKKMVQNAKDQGNEIERTILEAYLPKQLTEEELVLLINTEIEVHKYNSMKDMGKVMGFLKANFSGQYDGKVAGNLVREMLSKK